MGRTLWESHRRQLMEGSGISAEMLERIGWYSVTAEEASQILGIPVEASGIAIPYPGCDLVRVRLDWPHRFVERSGDGRERTREARYLSPRGSRTHAYILPEVAQALRNPMAVLAITEGEKKAVKATQEGLPAIAIPGVWSWRGRTGPHQERGEMKETGFLPELAAISWEGRPVWLFWDSDAAQNMQVLEAGRALEAELRRRGANARLVVLPPLPDGSKQGLDDYLLHHSLQELFDYAREAQGPGERNFEILALAKFLTDPPTYMVRLNWGPHAVVGDLTIEDLDNFARFRRRVAQALNRMPVFRERRRGDWQQYLDDVMATVLFEEEVPEEARTGEVWWQRVLRYLEHRATSDLGAFRDGRAPYRDDQYYYVPRLTLLEYLQSRYGPIDPKRLWQVLERHNAEACNPRFGEGQEAFRRRVWRIPIPGSDEESSTEEGEI